MGRGGDLTERKWWRERPGKNGGRGPNVFRGSSAESKQNAHCRRGPEGGR